MSLTPASRVLVVDEDSDVLNLVAHHLGSAGYEVAITTDPLTAHDMWIADPTEVIVVDADIGRLGGGIRLAKGLRLLKPNLVVVVMSGAAVSEEVEGFVLLAKPFSRNALLAALRAAIDGLP